MRINKKKTETITNPSSAGSHVEDPVLFGTASVVVVEDDIISLRVVAGNSSMVVEEDVVDQAVVDVVDAVVEVLFVSKVVVEDAPWLIPTTVTSIFLETPPYRASALYFPGLRGMNVYSSFRSGMSLAPVHRHAA